MSELVICRVGGNVYGKYLPAIKTDLPDMLKCLVVRPLGFQDLDFGIKMLTNSVTGSDENLLARSQDILLILIVDLRICDSSYGE